MNIAVVTRTETFVVNERWEVLGNILPPGYCTYHYGLTWNEDYMFAFCWGAYQWVEVLDHNLDSVGRILEGVVSGTHQMIWHGDRLWACNTNRDEYIVCDAEGNIDFVWKPRPEQGMPDSHFNSIWFDGEDVVIVAANWAKREAEILRYSPGLELIDRQIGAWAAHSAYLHQDKYLTLGIGRVKWGEEIIEIPTTEVMKGIVHHGDTMIFGVQQNIPDRAKRLKAVAGWLVSVDPNTMAVRDMVNFDRMQTTEIRLLDLPDGAHHGMAWQGKWGRE